MKVIDTLIAFFESKPGILICGLITLVFVTVEYYYGEHVHNRLPADVYGTIVIDTRSMNGVSNRYLLIVRDGEISRRDVVSDTERIKYPAPRTLNIATDITLSHNRKRLAFYKDGCIYTSDTLGGNVVEVVGGYLIVAPIDEAAIAWSPNDRYLAFIGQTIAARYTWPTYNLYIVPIDRKNVITLVCHDIDRVFYWQ